MFRAHLFPLWMCIEQTQGGVPKLFLRAFEEYGDCSLEASDSDTSTEDQQYIYVYSEVPSMIRQCYKFTQCVRSFELQQRLHY